MTVPWRNTEKDKERPMPQSLVSWGILEEIADTDTVAIDKDDIIYAVTDNFGYFKSDFLDAVLGGPEGLSKKTDTGETTNQVF